MKIIMSPAKKMRVDSDYFAVSKTLLFPEKSKEILSWLREKDFKELKELWKCNEDIARLNQKRIHEMDIEGALTPAVLSYDGISYQHLAAKVMDESNLLYIQNHLFIMSAFYGLLRPFDKVMPYRLELQAVGKIKNCKNLYEFWGDLLYKECVKEDKVIINLASAEYHKIIKKYLQKEDRFITITFLENHRGKLVTKPTYAKMARGEMVRFMAEHQVEDVEEIKKFDRLGFSYRDDLSDKNEFVFERSTGQI